MLRNLIVILALGVFLYLPMQLHAAILKVPTQFATLNEALAAAAAGDTILAAEGIYRERLNITKAIHIWGANDLFAPDDPDRLAESRIMPNSGRAVTINCDCAVDIRGFTFESKTAAAIANPTGKPSLRLLNNRFRAQPLGGGGGLVLGSLSRFDAWNNEFVRLTHTDTAVVQLTACLNLQFQRNRIDSCSSAGLRIDSTDNTQLGRVYRNRFLNLAGSGIVLSDDSGSVNNLEIRENDFDQCNNLRNNNAGGIYVFATRANGFFAIDISNNRIDGSYNGIAFRTGRAYNGSQWRVRFNRLGANVNYGIYQGGSGSIDATGNWWNSPNGPTDERNNEANPGLRNFYFNDTSLAYSPWLSEFTDELPDTAGLQLAVPAVFWAKQAYYTADVAQKAVRLARSGDVVRFSDSDFSKTQVSIDRNLTFRTMGMVPRFQRWIVEGATEAVVLSTQGRFAVDTVQLTIGLGGSIQTGTDTLVIHRLLQEDAGRAVFGYAENSQNLSFRGSNFAGLGLTLSTGLNNIGDVTVTRASGAAADVLVESSKVIRNIWNIRADGNLPFSGRQLTLRWHSDSDNGVDLTRAQLWNRNNEAGSWLPLRTRQNLTPLTQPRVFTDSIFAFGSFAIGRPAVCKNLSVRTQPELNRCLDDDPTTINATVIGGNGGIVYTWSPPDDLSTTNAAFTRTSTNVFRIYTVSVRDDSGCVATSVTRVFPTLKPQLLVSPSQTLCLGDSVQLEASGASQYFWQPDSSVSGSGLRTPFVMPTETTTYTVIGGTANGCTTTKTVEVRVVALPIIDAGRDTVLCFGREVRFRATSNINNTQLSWSPSAGLTNTTGSSVLAQPMVSTTYIVRGTTPNGCISRDTVRVGIQNLPKAYGGPDRILCRGSKVQLSASGGITYHWTPNVDIINPDSINPIVNPLSTTPYYVDVTDSLGCMARDTVQVRVVATPFATALGDSLICIGGSARLRAFGGSTYRWSPSTGLDSANIATPFASPLVNTRYYVEVRDTNGCTARDSVDIGVASLPQVSIEGRSSMCAADSIPLQAFSNKTPVHVMWTPTRWLSDTTSLSTMARPLGQTTYTVTVRDENGCIGQAEHFINVVGRPFVSVSRARALCPGGSTQLQANGGDSYSWTPRAGLSDANIYNPVASPDTSTTYEVTVTNPEGCSATGLVRVTILLSDQPLINPAPYAYICPGGRVTLNAPIENGLTYQWYLEGKAIANSTSSSFTALAEGNYSVEINTNGCRARSAATLVAQQPHPAADAGPDVFICTGGIGKRLEGSGGVFFRWEPVTGLSANDTPTPLAFPTTNTTYTVYVTDITGCTAKDEVSVFVNKAPSVSLGVVGSATLCTGEFTTLRAYAEPPVFYEWERNGIVLANATEADLRVSQSGQYLVRVSRPGCPAAESEVVNIITYDRPTVSAGSELVICRNSPGYALSGSAEGVGDLQYRWTPTDGLSATAILNPVARPFSTTTYTLTVTDRNGCKATDAVRVLVRDQLPRPLIYPLNPLAFCFSETRVISTDSFPGYSFQWRLNRVPIVGATSSELEIDSAGLYSVVIRSAGCSEVASEGKGIVVNIIPEISVSVTLASCPTCKDGSIRAVTGNGTGGYRYSLDGKTFFTANIFGELLPGKYIVYVEDGIGCRDSIEVTVGDLVGRSDRQDAIQVVLYPNPNAGQFVLTFDLARAEQAIEMQVLDAVGRKVWSQTLPSVSSGRQELEVNLPTNFASGVYYFEANGTYFRANHKFVIR